MIIEYRLHRSRSGTLTVPSWVEAPGFFPNTSDSTFIGFSPSDSNRPYYMPDSVTELTVAELKARVVAIGMSHPEDPENPNGTPMTQAEIESHVDSIVADHNIA